MSSSILAVIQFSGSGFKKISLQVVSAARQLADRTGTRVLVLVTGKDLSQAVKHLIPLGPDKILLAQDRALSGFPPETLTDMIAGIVSIHSPSIILTGASSQEKDLCARLSARLDAGLAMDCTGIEEKDGKTVYIRSVFGGKLTAGLVIDSPVQIAVLRLNAFPVIAGRSGSSPAIEYVEIPAVKSRTRILRTILNQSGDMPLADAKTVVGGGRGTNGDFTPIEALAHLLKGTPAASRAVIDNGWRPQWEQIGQTGLTITPDLYIACGISGTVQHLAGISDCPCIVAVNKDPNAPVFDKSDYGIVGDLFKVIPELIKEIKKQIG